MDKDIYCHSESIILSLCKEIEYIKSRSKNINQSLKTCQNKILTNRLISELKRLNKTRLKILNISEIMFKNNHNKLSVEFFLEITKRSNIYQQI